MKHRALTILGMLLLVLSAAGCAVLGSGVGARFEGSAPIRLEWRSEDGISGFMSGAVPSAIRGRRDIRAASGIGRIRGSRGSFRDRPSAGDEHEYSARAIQPADAAQ